MTCSASRAFKQRESVRRQGFLPPHSWHRGFSSEVKLEMLDWIHSVTDLCLLGLLPSPHQGVGLGGNYCCCSQVLTSAQGIQVSFPFSFFSFINLSSLRRPLIVKTDTGVSLMSQHRFPPSPRPHLEITICGKCEDMRETKESSRFNLVGSFINVDVCHSRWREGETLIYGALSSSMVSRTLAITLFLIYSIRVIDELIGQQFRTVTL